MRTIIRIETETEEVQFGFWDPETNDFVPIDTTKVADLKAAVEYFGCSEEFIDALGAMFERLIEAVASDLEAIWKRLDEAQI